MINVSPTLFVGFGGSGSKALNEIKLSLKDVLKRSFPNTPGALSGEIPPCFQFLEVDIDQADALRSGFTDYGKDFLNCDPKATFEQLDARIRRADGSYEYIKQWWPQGLGTAISQMNRDQEMKEGYRLRQLGKLALWLNAKDFWDRVAKCELDCTSDNASKDVSNLYGGGLNVKGTFEIYVVASIAGGTGCGMIIDGLFMLYNILKGRYYGRTYLLLPSVYSEIIKSGNTEPLVNAYATLKEYDHFNHGNAKYTAELGRRLSIKAPNNISQRTYILGGRTEGNKTFDGKGRIVCEKAARLIVNSVFGFNKEEERRMQEDKRPLTGREVSAFYQSPNVHELRYPNAEIEQFIQTYTKQLLAAYLRKDKKLAEYTKDYAPIGDIISCSEEYANQSILERCFDIQRLQEPDFSSAQAESYLPFKRKAAEHIRVDFDAAKKLVDRAYASNRKWEDNKKAILNDVKDWLYNSIGSIFADYRDGGVDAVDLFLRKVEKIIKRHQEVHPFAPKSDTELKAMEESFERDFPTFFFSFAGPKTKSKYIEEVFLEPLQREINDQINFRMESREKEIADAILEIVTDCSREWDKIYNKLSDICSSCWHKTQDAARVMGEQVAQLNWVGCSPDEIQILKNKIKLYARDNYPVLAGVLKSIIQEHSDVRKPKGPEEREKDIELKIEKIEKKIDDQASDALNKKDIHDKSISVVDRVIDYVKQYRSGAGQENPLMDFLGKDVLPLSEPLNMVEAVYKDRYWLKYILASIPQEDLDRLQRESNLSKIKFMQLDYLDPHSLLFVQTNQDLTTDEFRDIHEYYEAYCDCNKNPAPSKYSGINLTAHLFDDSTWKEIVHVDVTEDDVKNYIKLGQKLKVVVRHGKGKTPYWTIVDPLKSSSSDKPEDQSICKPFVGEAQLADALLKDNTLLNKLKNVLIATMCNTFKYGFEGKQEYDKFKNDLKATPSKGKGKNDSGIVIPDEIESVVANNMGWNNL